MDEFYYACGIGKEDAEYYDCNGDNDGDGEEEEEDDDDDGEEEEDNIQ